MKRNIETHHGNHVLNVWTPIWSRFGPDFVRNFPKIHKKIKPPPTETSIVMRFFFNTPFGTQKYSIIIQKL